MSKIEEAYKVKAHQFMFIVNFLLDKAKIEAQITKQQNNQR